MKKKLSIIGLGYVGLPLAVEFSKNDYDVVGFDIDEDRLNQLRNGKDETNELSDEELAQAKKLLFTNRLEDIETSQIYIVTAPTPITKNKIPDLQPLINASKTIGKVLKIGDIVVYESTVYPGCTEEDCVPILEKESGLKFNKDFYCGYSPERINPGDKQHRVGTIVKITSGSTPKIAKEIDELYSSIVRVGTHQAPSIKVAEAAKVIENAQRDINIAFVNELSMIFDRMDINIHEVLKAAGTKWNFLPFKPGLVGGHCIGVDPYYLAYKAKEIGHNPEIILAGRRINDGMGKYVAQRFVKQMIKKGINIQGAKVLVYGITFKPDVPDIRNTKVIDVIRELEDYGIKVDVYDPLADWDEVKNEFGIEMVEEYEEGGYDGVFKSYEI